MSAGNSHWFPSTAELRLIDRAIENGGWRPEQIAEQLKAPVIRIREIMAERRVPAL